MRHFSSLILALILAAAVIPGCFGGGSDGGTPVSDSSALSNLAVSDGVTLSPAFSGTVLSYTASVPKTMTNCDVTAYAGHTSQTIEINGSSSDSGEAVSVAVADGETAVKIKVTSGSGTWQI